MKQIDKELIVYQDNHILIANKRANLLTQKDNTDGPSLQDEIIFYLKNVSRKEKIFLACVHRLDKPVSGLVLFARSSKALKRLNEEMKNQNIKKRYIALVHGKVKEKKSKLESYIIHDNYKARIVKEKTAAAKIAILSYEVVQQFQDQTLVEISLITGRYHQIRAQFAHLGHPIVGDKKYGSKEIKDEICLHSSYLEFVHPTTKEKTVFKNIKKFK